tara:strand:+ start:428 stop:1084 length:657 start_codon:yes stop_codon:yes gene_type:complete
MAKTILEHWHSSFSATSPPDSSHTNDANGNAEKGLQTTNEFNEGTFVGNLETNTFISSANEIPSGRTFTILGFLGATLGQGKNINESTGGNAANGLALRGVSNILGGTSTDGTLNHLFRASAVSSTIQLNNTLVFEGTVKKGFTKSTGKGSDSKADGNLFDEPVTRGNKRIGTNSTVITEWGNLTDRALSDGVINSEGEVDKTQVTDFNRFAGSELTQ